VAGVAPFTGASVADILVAILDRQPPPLAQRVSDLPVEFERIVSRCLAKQREQRFQHAKELLADLKALVARLSQPQSAPASSPSIAVLPFVNMSADLENDYFCDGLAEELINALSKIEALHVVARSAAFSFKGKESDVREIGRKLNVSTALEGSVRKSGEQLRITAQLINVADGYHLWSERYDRRLEDIFDIQDEISLAIVGALKVKLLGAEKATVLKRYTDDAEAYQLYLKGRYFWFKFNPEGWMKSRACFEQAVQRDPNFALAYSGLADVFAVSAVVTPANEVFPKAREAALRALKLDPSMAEAWGSKAAVAFFYDWDWDGAESEITKSIDLNPRNALARDLYCLILLTQGRFEEAIREARKAYELEPLSGYFNASVGLALYFSRRYNDAADQFLKGIDLDPGNLWSHMWLVDLFEQQGMHPDALYHRQTLLTLAGKNELAVEIGQEFQRSGYQGVLLKCLAELHQQSQRRYVSPLDFATIHARLGEREKALDWLEKAFSERTLYLSFLKVNPTWESLHSDPRYADLLRRIGLSL
jgi:TolB-like protein/Tfp pilus assembly protein PilF